MALSFVIIIGPKLSTLIVTSIISLILRSFVIILQYEQGIQFRYGRAIKKLEPGINFIIPLIDVIAVADKRINTLEVPFQKVITKDNANVLIEVIITIELKI